MELSKDQWAQLYADKESEVRALAGLVLENRALRAENDQLRQQVAALTDENIKLQSNPCPD